MENLFLKCRLKDEGEKNETSLLCKGQAIGICSKVQKIQLVKARHVEDYWELSNSNFI
jgi:hypothetical protein